MKKCVSCKKIFDKEKRQKFLIKKCGHEVCGSCVKILMALSQMRKVKCPVDNGILNPRGPLTSDDFEYERNEINYKIMRLGRIKKNVFEKKKSKLQDQIFDGVPDGLKVCKKHDRMNELLCLEDMKLVCTKCALFGDYKGKKIKPIDVALKEMKKWNHDISSVQEKSFSILEKMDSKNIDNYLDEFGNANYDRKRNQICNYFENLRREINKLERVALTELEDEYRRLRVRTKDLFESIEGERMEENRRKLEEICSLDTKDCLTLADLKNYFRFKDCCEYSGTQFMSAEKLLKKKIESLKRNISSLDIEFLTKEKIFPEELEFVKFFDNIKLTEEIQKTDKKEKIQQNIFKVPEKKEAKSSIVTQKSNPKNDAKSLLDMSLNSLDSNIDFETQYGTLINPQQTKSPSPITTAKNNFSCRTLFNSNKKSFKKSMTKRSPYKSQILNFGSVLRHKNEDKRSRYSNYNKRTADISPIGLKKRLNYQTNDCYFLQQNLFNRSIRKQHMRSNRTRERSQDRDKGFYSINPYTNPLFLDKGENEENNRFMPNSINLNIFKTQKENVDTIKPQKRKKLTKHAEIVKNTKQDNLDFTASNISDKIFESIALHIRANKFITKLKFSMNKITDEGLIATFSQLKGKKFKGVYLAQNRLSDKSFFYLSSLLTSKSIKISNLYLQGNKIDTSNYAINRKLCQMRDMGINVIL